MKRNLYQSSHRWVARGSLGVLLLLTICNSPALLGQIATDEITTVNQDDVSALPLLPPVAWLDKQGITLEEFLQQRRQRVEIKVENAGFAQAVGVASPLRLQSSDKKPVEIAAHNAGAAHTLNLLPLGGQPIAGRQSLEIEVQQAGAQATFAIDTALSFAPASPRNVEILVEHAGYTRELDLVELAWQ